MAKITAVLILLLFGQTAVAGPWDYIQATFDKSKRWTDGAMSEKEVAAQPPIELRAARGSCHGQVTDGTDVILVNGEEKTALTLKRGSHQQASRLLVYCGRALFRAQQADGTKDSTIPYRQFVLDDPNLPSAGFLVDPPRVSIERDPFSNLGYLIYIDRKLPVASVTAMQRAKLEAAIEEAKSGRKLLALDWSHPVDVKNHPMLGVRDAATASVDPDHISPESAN